MIVLNACTINNIRSCSGVPDTPSFDDSHVAQRYAALRSRVAGRAARPRMPIYLHAQNLCSL